MSPFLLACLAYLTVALPGSTLGLLWPSMRISFHEPVGALGILLAFGVTASVISSAATGRILPRVGVGPLLALGTMLTAVALALEALSPSLGVVTVGFVLFGLGFDTASEIAVIALSVTLGVSGAVPLYVVLVYPLLFMVGMVLVDTSDGIAMRFAYGWAFLRPVRKVYYNLTVTITSILIAFVIGSVELLQVLSQELNLTGPIWDGLKGLDFETVGYLIIGVLLATWGIAYAYYRYKRLDQMVVGPDPSSAPPPGHQEFEMG